MNTTPEGSSQPQKAAAKAAAGALTPAAGQDNSVMDVLENTLWNRQLGVMSEEIVAALVCQIFEGSRFLSTCPHSLYCNHNTNMLTTMLMQGKLSCRPTCPEHCVIGC